MTPAETPKDEPEEGASAEPAAPKKWYLLVGKTSIKGPFTAEQLSENPDFGEHSKLAPLGATKASHWKPVERFAELRAILDARKAAAEAPKPAPDAKPKPPTGH